MGTFVAASLAGCLADDEDDEPTLDPDDPPAEPDSITVRAWGGVWEESLAEHVGETFTEETGIEVTYDNTDIEVTGSDIRSAVQDGREPPVNVNWSIVNFVHREYLQGLASPLHDEIVDHASEIRDIGHPDTDGFPYVGLYGYTYALCYNEAVLEEVQGHSEPVDSWEDLWDAQYEDWIGLYDDPVADGLYPVLAELADEDLGAADEMEDVWSLVEDIEPNIGYLGSDASLSTNLQEGEIAYAAGYLPNNLLTPIEEGEPVDWTIPDEGATWRMDCMYTPRGQSESELYWSQRFIDVACRRHVQAEWMDALAVPMFNENVEPLEWMDGDPAYPSTEAEFDQLIDTDLDAYVEHSPEWFDEVALLLA